VGAGTLLGRARTPVTRMFRRGCVRKAWRERTPLIYMLDNESCNTSRGPARGGTGGARDASPCAVGHFQTVQAILESV